MLMETLEYLGIAFICSVLLIILSKIILQSLIRRPADYYDAKELLQEELMLNAGGISITSEHETTPEGEIMEETHLEAHIAGIEAAEPEEIITDIPESVIESIEAEEIEEEIEPDNDTDLDDDADMFEEPEPEPEPEPVAEPEPELAPYEFRIKARTTRERKPIKPVKREEEEPDMPAEVSEESTQEGWPESYDEIRNSLEQAYTKKKKKNRRRKPSMNMSKAELVKIAESKGIAIPEDATKRMILGLIYEEKKQNGRNYS